MSVKLVSQEIPQTVESLSARVKYLESLVTTLHGLVHSVAGHSAPALTFEKWTEQVEEQAN